MSEQERGREGHSSPDQTGGETDPLTQLVHTARLTEEELRAPLDASDFEPGAVLSEAVNLFLHETAKPGSPLYEAAAARIEDFKRLDGEWPPETKLGNHINKMGRAIVVCAQTIMNAHLIRKREMAEIRRRRDIATSEIKEYVVRKNLTRKSTRLLAFAAFGAGMGFLLAYFGDTFTGVAEKGRNITLASLALFFLTLVLGYLYDSATAGWKLTTITERYQHEVETAEVAYITHLHGALEVAFERAVTSWKILTQAPVPKSSFRIRDLVYNLLEIEKDHRILSRRDMVPYGWRAWIRFIHSDWAKARREHQEMQNKLSKLELAVRGQALPFGVPPTSAPKDNSPPDPSA